MAKKIILNILLVFALPFLIAAQQKDSTTSLNRLLIVQATISPGYMFYDKGLWNSYFHCTLEWCFDRRVSIRADGFYFFSSQGNYEPLKMDHSLLLGAFYHFPKKKFDFYVGIQPGASIVQQNPYHYQDTMITNPKLKVTPVITGAVGINYFFWKYMNMFAALKYIHGNHVSQYGKTIPLDELCISFGIGWHIRFKRTGSHIKVVGY